MESIKLKLFFILIFFSISHFIWAADSCSAPQIAKFISIADIHFDPFSGCTKPKKICLSVNKLRQVNYQEWPQVFERYGDKKIAKNYKETNYVLLKATLLKLQEMNTKEKPAFAMILGDFLAHDFREKYIDYSGDKSTEGFQKFVKKTFQFLTFEISQAFPNIDVYPVVGNNDTYSGDYQLVPRGKFFQDLTEIWSILIKDKENRESFKHEFPVAGYYQMTLPIPFAQKKQKAIILDTVLFSKHNYNLQVKEAAFKQLNWLANHLQNAAEHHENLFLAYHIPSGIDPYATFFKAKLGDIQEFWKPSYNTQFANELQNYPYVITGIFCGHIHSDTFQNLTLRKFGDFPVIVTPSISPIFGNEPAFKIFSFDTKTLKLKSIDRYTFNLDQNSPSWQKEHSDINEFETA